MYEVRGGCKVRCLSDTNGAEPGGSMKRMNYIGVDVHSSFCEGGYVDHTGRERGGWRTPTSIPQLVEAIEKVPRPRSLVIEEGPLADWLARNLRGHVDELVVCDPHRNAL